MNAVANGELDPRTLLQIYVNDPISLAIDNKRDPTRKWVPGPRYKEELPIKKNALLSRYAALCRLIGSFQQQFLGSGEDEAGACQEGPQVENELMVPVNACVAQ